MASEADKQWLEHLRITRDHYLGEVRAKGYTKSRAALLRTAEDCYAMERDRQHFAALPPR